ncbi:MAG TPA: inorganic diphosphatase [Chitinophagaceae bacterium]|jgi:inorganic pyrophosphatase|nr:inorganic diphosphatase [Chitinophagaceae bacterium]
MQYHDIIIETVKGNNLKYKYDPQTGIFKVRKALPLGMVFPYDFGFIEGTKGEDGDPLDAMIISEFTSFTGCKTRCRLVGVLLAEQTEGRKKIRNDRYFFIPDESIIFASVSSMKQLGNKHNGQLKDFFINYNKAENKLFTPLKMISAEEGARLLQKANSTD